MEKNTVNGINTRDLEKLLISVWQEVLNVPHVGLHDNFFDLGGDSIRAVRLLNRLQQQSEHVLYPTALFRAPTVSQMAEFLMKNHPECVYRLLEKDQYLLGPEVTHDSLLPSGSPVLTQERIAEISDALQHALFRFSDIPGTEKKNRPAVFILSPPRSGSTLLRVMLAGNPALFSPPELNLMCFNDMRSMKVIDSEIGFLSVGLERTLMEIFGVDVHKAKDMLEDFSQRKISVQECYALLQDSIGKRMLVDKSPLYCASLPVLRKAEVLFDRPYYIHLMRHPYAMVRSYLGVKMHLLFDLPFSGRERAEFLWLTGHQNILELLRDIPARRQFHVKFEDLVGSPKHTMEDLCQFLSIPFDDRMLQPYEGKKMTDGTYEGGPMIGDPRFFSHQTINPEVAKKSKNKLDEPICEATRKVALSLGYTDL